MFGFQLGSLHIFKDVVYDANNNVSSSMYQISIITVQGQEWVVNYGSNKVVGANVFAHSQETILTLKTTTTSVVKAMIWGCNKMEDIFYLDANLHTSNIAPSSVFIDSSSSSSEKPLVESSATRLCPTLSAFFEAMLYQSTSEPSTLITSIQSIVDCLHAMLVLDMHLINELCTLDYDKITILAISFLPTTFNSDILFKLPSLSPSNPSSAQM
jgi:hypothetical protein